MTQDQQDIQKVYVNQDNIAVIKCPACEQIKTSNVDQFKGTRHVLNVKCSCQEVFMVSLEFRKAYRKEIKFSGNYTLLPEQIHSGRMMIQNISKTGVGMQVLGVHRLAVGQKLRVTFNLDDKHNSLVDKKVVVRLVEGSYVGCEFLEVTMHDKAIGFYLMV